MKQFFALVSIYLMSLLMIAQNAEAQRDSLRVEKAEVITADGDTMVVIKTFPMRVNITSPMRGRGTVVSAEGDTLMITRRSPRRVWDMVVRGNVPYPLHAGEEVVVSADGDTMIVTKRPSKGGWDMVVRGDRPHPPDVEEVIVSADGDTMMVTRRFPRRVVDMVARGNRPYPLDVEEEVIVNADGDTTMITRRYPRRMRDIVVRGNRTNPLHEAEVTVSIDGDTMMVTKRSPERGRRGDRKREVVIEREIVNSDGDTTIVSVVRGGGREVRLRRSRTGHQMRHRLRHRSGSRRQMRVRDVHREHGDSRELREMETEARRLARELRQADEETHSEKEEMLRAQLEKIFDHKQAMKMKELDQKRSDIEEQSRIIEERQSNREAIIKDRIHQLLGYGSLYRW